MNIAKALVALLAVVIAPQAGAGADVTYDATFRVLPQPPREGEPLRLQIDNEAGCFDGGNQADIHRSGNQIAIEFFGVDHACPEDYRTPLYVQLGTFVRGTYELVVRLCPVPPLPCVDIDAQTQVVQPPPQRLRVPALSFVGMFAGVFGLLAVAFLRRR